MSNLDSIVKVPRRTMVLFFIVDTSGSMTGAKIGAVNTAIEEVVDEIASISSDNAEAQIKIATMAFSTYTKWLYNGPVDAENFVWNYLEPEGITSFGLMCEELNNKLSRREFMQEASGSYAPAIILLSDGAPTDSYKKGLSVLKQNNWFKRAIKMALAIGTDANQEVLAEFTGNSETVVFTNKASTLKEWIKFASVTSSQIGSKSSVVEPEMDARSGFYESEQASTRKQTEFMREIQNQGSEEFSGEEFDWESFDDDGEW